MLELIQSIYRTRDWQAVLLMLFVVVASGWILLLPVSRSVQLASLQRFHLASPSFVQWAIQQPIPAINNFENRYWIGSGQLVVADLKPDLPSSKDSGVKTGMASHFPAGIFTFADSRHSCLRQEKANWLYLQSRYRGEDLTTILRASTDSDGGFLLQRNVVDDE